MSYGNLFNGEAWELDPDVDFGRPWNVVTGLVEMTVQPPE